MRVCVCVCVYMYVCVYVCVCVCVEERAKERQREGCSGTRPHRVAGPSKIARSLRRLPLVIQPHAQSLRPSFLGLYPQRP